MHRHCDIFKIGSSSVAPDRMPSTTAPGGGAATVTADGETLHTDRERADRDELVAQLRQMQSLGADECKRVSRRLYLLWHPDKNRSPHAHAFCCVIRRFMDEFNGSRNFDFLDQFADRGEEVATQAASSAEMPSYTSEAAPNSWSAEFEREREREASAVTGAKAAAASRSAAIAVGGGSRPSNACVPARRLDFEEADRFHIQSARVEQAAAALEIGLHECSIFWSHQAAELILKSLMLWTCGITEDEMRGGQGEGHSLTSLMSYILATEQQAWPAGLEQELAWLSHAYIDARYPGIGTLPASRYQQDHDSAALKAVSKLKVWVAACFALPTPTAQASVTVELVSNFDSHDEAFEPAPLPSSAARPPGPAPAIEPAPTPQSIADQHAALRPELQQGFEDRITDGQQQPTPLRLW
jgi:HEPN domain-containing protein